MNGLKDIAKGGWHPKGRDGGTDSGRGERKGHVDRVAGWMGKGKSPSEAAHEHQSTPLSTLKDPASFGPPPKRNTHPAPPPPPQRTGMKPQLPPRLPPRQNENPDAYTPAPPPPYSERPQDEAPQAGRLNQEAVNRLGQAGISVPGLDIGRRTTISPPVPPRRTAPQSAQTPTPPLSPANGALHQAPPLGELQSRFAKMKTPSADSPTTGTSWAEKKAALNTMHSFRNDPSKVSVSDMKAAASTANNFRERHGEQTTGGWRAANDMQQRYGGTQSASSPTSASPPLPSPSVPGLGKKAPPPPPPKRKELSFGQNNKPPPVPLGSKPRF